MIRNTFFGLEIGRSGLTTAQFNLDVTSHNIANVNTDGYTRQRTVATAHDPFSTIGRVLPSNNALVGGGTRIMVLDQIRSAYLDRRFRTESTQNAYFETRTQSLTYVRSFFNDHDTSINQSLADFFRAMTTVAADPVSGAPRTSLQTAAKDMIQQLNMIHEGLMNLQAVENRAVIQKTEDINRIAEHLSELNMAIYRFEMTGMIANDLRDQRNLLLDNLSRLVDIEYEEVGDPNLDNNMLSTMIVRVAGEVLVNHDMANRLEIAMVANDMEGGAPIAIPFWTHRVQGELMPAVDISATDFDVNSDEYSEHLWTLFGGNESANLSATSRWNSLTVAGATLNMSRLTGGELKAHIDIRDGMGNGVDSFQRGIPFFVEQMNDLARALVQEINEIHTKGWSDNPLGSETNVHFFAIRDENGEVHNVGEWALDGIPPTLLAGHPDFDQDDRGAWFNTITGEPIDLNSPEFIFHIPGTNGITLDQVTARNVVLSEAISESPFNIAASDVMIIRAGGDDGGSENLQRGNNENMRRLHALFAKTSIVLFRGTDEERHIGGFDEFATRIRFEVGNTMHSAEQMAATSRVLTLAADNQRTAIAGVSLDEEMVGLVRFQHAFNGAARVITAMDDALDRIINAMGRVGL